MQKIRLSLAFILIISILFSGCTDYTPRQEGNKNDNDNNSSANNQDDDNSDSDSNKEDITKIVAYFSKDNQKYKRSISIIPTDDVILCSYNSDYLDNALFCTIPKEKFETISKQVISFSEKKWETDSVEKYDRNNFKTSKLNNCRIVIESDQYSFDGTSDKKNLCSGLLAILCDELFPLEWKSTISLDMKPYNNISYTYCSGNIDDDISTYNYINLASDEDNCISNKDERNRLLSEDTNKEYDGKILEIYSHNDNETNLSYATLYDYLPFEFEFYTTFNKTDINNFKENDDKPTLNTDNNGEITEDYYKFSTKDIENETEEYYLKTSTKETCDTNNTFSKIQSWGEELKKEFF